MSLLIQTQNYEWAVENYKDKWGWGAILRLLQPFVSRHPLCWLVKSLPIKNIIVSPDLKCNSRDHCLKLESQTGPTKLISSQSQITDKNQLIEGRIVWLMVPCLGSHNGWGSPAMPGTFSVPSAERLVWNRDQTGTPYPCFHGLYSTNWAPCRKSPTITQGNTISCGAKSLNIPWGGRAAHVEILREHSLAELSL